MSLLQRPSFLAPGLAALVVVSAVVADAGPRNAVPKTRPVFRAVALDGQAPAYSGERISLSLKAADLKDVLKTFAVLTGLNIVVDPEVRGSVTVELHDVPWDQAFEVILQVNGLWYHRHRNVVYVAPRGKLHRIVW
jgi:type IV pilus assembly protein PilQ